MTSQNPREIDQQGATTWMQPDGCCLHDLCHGDDASSGKHLDWYEYSTWVLDGQQLEKAGKPPTQSFLGSQNQSFTLE